MEDKEAEHMEEVANQFAQLKFAIDIQSIAESDIPISTPITLGSKELPYFVSSRAFGSLEILEDECSITITNSTAPYSYSIGTIKYSSTNAYFIDQSFIYEAGAIILNQSQGSVMVVDPFSADPKLNFSIVNISVTGEKTSASGYGTYPIQTKYSDYSTINNVTNISIFTNYPNAWNMSLNRTLVNSGLIYGHGNNFWITGIYGGIKVEFNTTVNVDLQVIKIRAQIGPGWIG